MMQRMIFQRQSGQSLPFVVLMLAVIFMIIGLGVDGGLLYAQRRLMQNTADAACLAAATRLAVGETNLQAEAAAQNVIAANLGVTPGSGANAPGTLSYTAIADLYTPVAGAGTALTRGIVVGGASGGTPIPGYPATSSAEIRVALQSPAFTYFVRVLGQAEYTVAARARCNATAGGGGTPFAVARWRAYRAGNGQLVGGLSTDLPLPGQSIVNNNQSYFVRDVLGRLGPNNSDPSRITQWPGWGSPGYPGSPTLGTALFSQANTPATPANPGVEVPIAGASANPNVGDASFAGQVMLDWRNITTGGEFYGGVNPNLSTNAQKDIVTRHIVEGYDGPWIEPGTQLGYTNGVSAGQVERPFGMRYRVNDVVPVLIYNGTIYQDVDIQLLQSSALTQSRSAPNFATPGYQGNFPNNCDLSSTAGAYMYELPVGVVLSPTVTLNPLSHAVTLRPYIGNNPNNSAAVQSAVRMYSFASVSGAAWNDLQVKWEVPSLSNTSGWLNVGNQGVGDVYPSVSNPGLNVNNTLARPFELDIQQSRTANCTVTTGDLFADPTTFTEQSYELPVRPAQGSAAVYVEAEDTNTGLRRGRYLLIRTGATNNQDFFAYFPGTINYALIDRPTSGTEVINRPFIIEYTNAGAVPSNQLSFGNYTWFENGNQIATPADLTASVVNVQGNNGGPTLRISVGPNAPLNRNLHLRVAVTSNGRTQWLWSYLRLRQPVSNSNSVTQYVYTLGYASYRITEIGSNYINGRAVSGLLRPGDVIAGMQPRLVPWEE